MSDKGRSPLEKLIYRAPEGLLLAGITGLGYFSAYMSDVGYKTYFGIPSMFVEINLNSVVLSICVMIFTLFISYLCISLPGFRRYGPHLFSVLIPTVIALIIGMKLSYSLSRENFGLILFLFLLHAAFLFLFFHLAQKQRRMTNVAAVTILSVLMISVSYFSGSTIAKNQEYYLVSNSKDPLVVIDTYKDALLVAPLDPGSRTLKPDYRFIHLESDLNEKLHFSMKKVGPLILPDP
ncbi:hypothetical protein C8P63_12166 [Melghirimyces profundicolus]|uniref:Uncharacterized protein n=1 Tax=Melghirimyces profundicolus TaxID=1242148 RepID=A0A2T6BGK7_9BACL|nr:hypothetical protein [Melghirimyces profundicolus]PTX55186.1 hypothetical protein C8P63_12166 [Melghirimyces profundicolus]